MTTRWAYYESFIMEISCPYCGMPPLSRCVGSVGLWTPPHKLRITQAGYRWDKKTHQYVKLD